MTCIIGLIDKGRVYIGGDSAGVSGLHISTRKDPKVFKVEKMVLGYTSSFRMGQLLRFKLKPSPHPKSMDDFEYLCTVFVEDVRKCLKEGGYSKIDNNQEEGGVFLLGYKRKLYCIESDFQVGQVAQPYDSVGCGAVYARGALMVIADLNLSPEQKVKKALSVAETFSAGVRRPFVIESI